MKYSKFIYIIFIFLMSAIVANPLALAVPKCTKIFWVKSIKKSYTPVSMDLLNEQFSKTKFKDNQGHFFKIKKLKKDKQGNLILAFNIYYQAKNKSGVKEVIAVSNTAENYEEMIISPGGNILDRQSIWQLAPKYRQLGLVKAPMRWWGQSLPLGSVFLIKDASETVYLRPNVTKKNLKEVLDLLEGDKVFKDLWDLFQRAYNEQTPSDETIYFEGYLNYIYDMFSIWGRIMRPVGYRSSYSEITSEEYMPITLIKGKYSKKLIQDENRFVAKHGAEIIRILFHLSRENRN